MKFLLTSVLLFLSIGCATTRYIPPSTQEGQTCVFQCDKEKLRCERAEEDTYRSCQDTAQLNYDICRIGNQFCVKQTCIRVTYHCKKTYKECFVSCGGKIVQE